MNRSLDKIAQCFEGIQVFDPKKAGLKKTSIRFLKYSGKMGVWIFETLFKMQLINIDGTRISTYSAYLQLDSIRRHMVDMSFEQELYRRPVKTRNGKSKLQDTLNSVFENYPDIDEIVFMNGKYFAARRKNHNECDFYDFVHECALKTNSIPLPCVRPRNKDQ